MPDKYAVHLSQERLVEYGEGFFQFDEEGKGRIPVDSLLLCMRKVGLMPSMCEIEGLIRGVDKDNDILAEGLTLEHFCQIGAQKEKDIYKEEDIIKAFRMFDVESDGYITLEALINTLCTQGEKLTEEEITAMINTAGNDENGHIYYEEFVKRMMSRD